MTFPPFSIVLLPNCSQVVTLPITFLRLCVRDEPLLTDRLFLFGENGGKLFDVPQIFNQNCV